MIWLLILVSTLFQALLYWLCFKFSVKWIDYFIFLAFFIGNFWFIPNIFFPAPTEESSCALDENSTAHGFFAIFGTAGTILTFIGYGIVREEKK